MNYRSVSGHSPKSHLILIEIDIQKERKRLEKQRRKRLAAQETKKRTTDDDVKSQAHADMIKASSNLGTMAKDMAMRQILPNAKQLPTDIPGKGESGQFDSVYIDGDQIYVVESKGGSSDLGSRKDLDGQQSQQGTPQYIASVIANMDQKVKDGYEDPRYGTDPEFTAQIDKLSDTLDILIPAQREGRITSLQISQRVDSNGNLVSSVEVKKFENYSKKAPTAPNQGSGN